MYVVSSKKNGDTHKKEALSEMESVNGDGLNDSSRLFNPPNVERERPLLSVSRSPLSFIDHTRPAGPKAYKVLKGF